MRRILLSRILLKRYAPFYLALLVIGVVMALLFLRPDSALGLTVEVSAVKKFPDFPAPAGFKLGDPVIINADVGLQGDFEPIKKVTLTVAQDTGDAGFTGFTVNLPFPQAPNYAPIASADISGSLPVVGGQTQGKLFVDVRLVETTPDPFGYGYGYRGKLGDGFIKYTITYVPPKIRGTYTATFRLLFVQDSPETLLHDPVSTKFSILGPFVAGDLVALPTIYPRSAEGALSRDMVVLRAMVPASKFGSVVSITADPGLLNPNKDTMASVSSFHPALLEKWDIDTRADWQLALPFKVIPQQGPLTGTFFVSLRAIDTAGQVLELGGSAGAPVKVLDKRQTFNVYLMPNLNFLSTPLQCATGDCAANSEHKISNLLAQAATRGAPGIATLADAVEIMWYYCPDGGACPSGGAAPKFVSYAPGRAQQEFTAVGTGKGYIVKAKDSAFKTLTFPGGTQFPVDLEVPVPIKLTFSGAAVALPPPFTPAGQEVKEIWNLVGLHSERDSTVGNLVNNVDLEAERLWIQLLGFENSLDILLDANGLMVRDRATGKPVVTLVQNVLQNLSFNRNQSISAGDGFWLEMCADVGRPQCNGIIGPVLEPR